MERWNCETIGFISESVQGTIKRYTISCRDIYVSIAGTIGKSGVALESLDRANLTENAAMLVPSQGWDRGFVYWATRSSDFRRQVVEQTRIAAQPKLALQHLGAIKISEADREARAILAGNMIKLRENIVELRSAYGSKLVQINALRQALLHYAFAGQLTA